MCIQFGCAILVSLGPLGRSRIAFAFEQFAFENCFRYAAQSPGNVMIFILEYPGKVLECSFQFSVGTLNPDYVFGLAGAGPSNPECWVWQVLGPLTSSARSGRCRAL